MFGDFGAMQAQIKEQLEDITVTAEAGDGAIEVTANANRKVMNIKIKPEIVDPTDVEQLEDLLVVALNRALEKAEVKAAAEMQKIAQSMLPGGLGGLGDLFK